MNKSSHSIHLNQVLNILFVTESLLGDTELRMTVKVAAASAIFEASCKAAATVPEARNQGEHVVACFKVLPSL